MPLFVVSAGYRQVIVNAGTVAEAVQIGNSFVGGPAQARLATDADTRSIPLLGGTIRGDLRPAIEVDPAFIQSFGLGGGALVEGGVINGGGPGVGGNINFGSGNLGSPGDLVSALSPGGGNAPDTEIQDDFTEGAYLTGLRNAGRDPYGAFGKYLRGRMAPAVATYRFNEMLGSPDPTGIQGFSERNARGTTQGLNQQAYDTFQRLSDAGSVPATSQFRQDQRAPLFNAQVDDEGGTARRDALNLAFAGASSRMSPYWAKQGYNPNRVTSGFEEEMYKNALSGSDQGVNFVNYLKRYFGL